MRIDSVRTAILFSTLMAATTCFVTPVSLAEDAAVSESPHANRPTPAWTASRIAETERASPPALPREHDRSYTLALVTAYIAMPFIAVGASVGLAAAADSSVVFGDIVLGVALGAAAPSIVHFSNDRGGRGVASWLAVPAIFFSTAFIVTLVSLGVLSATRDTQDLDSAEMDNSVSANLETALLVGVGGGLLATAGWAIYDVIATQRLAERAAQRESPALRFDVVPRPDGVAAVLGGRF
jgi:hypothetical protein